MMILSDQQLHDQIQAVALQAHHGHTNKFNGEPYVLHLQRVAIRVRDAGYDLRTQAVAWAHDVIEDTAVTELDLRVLFPDDADVVDSIVAISKVGDGKEDEAYYRRVCNDYMAWIVKRKGDREDNVARIPDLPDEAEQARLTTKYAKADRLLGTTGPLLRPDQAAMILARRCVGTKWPHPHVRDIKDLRRAASAILSDRVYARECFDAARGHHHDFVFIDAVVALGLP